MSGTSHARPPLAILGVAILIGGSAAADTPDHSAEIEAAWAAAKQTATLGPASIKLRDEANLALPANEAFIPPNEAAQLMRAYGNPTGEQLVGLVVPTDNQSWLTEIAFIKDGYVEDTDAKGWKPDALLASLREGTEQANEDRITRGYPALDVIGWIEPPAYDDKTHRLVWSMAVTDRGAPADAPSGVNYNTYALGREGYFSLDLLSSTKTIETDKQAARALLADLTYLPGHRYEDFQPGTDHIAEYGLAALVGGVVLKKLGFLALAGVFLLKVWKIGMLAVVGVGAAVRRWFRARASR
jgi:uncharacterized membrane-anchored protein